MPPLSDGNEQPRKHSDHGAAIIEDQQPAEVAVWRKPAPLTRNLDGR